MIENPILDNIHLSDGRNISIDTGLLAKQSNGSVVVSMGNTMLLASVVAEKEGKEDVDILPLIVDYRQNYSAVGKIPGGFIKREGRAFEEEILTMRIVDRVLRPLFPTNLFADIQIMVSLLSYDDEILPNVLAALAASASLAISDIPFYGPISEVRLVRITGGRFIINPSLHDVLNSDIDLVIGGSKESIIMMEGEMKEVSEEEILEAILFAHKAIKNQIEAQVHLAKRVKRSRIKRFYEKEILEPKKFMHHYYLQLKRESIRDLIIRENHRIDGRTSKEIRSLFSTVDCIPSAHGSALFMRGETQSLSYVTLGSSNDVNRIDNAIKEENEKFYLHYNFPPFSTGDIRLLRGVSRREVGHGNLAQSALKNIIPENTPYTIRIVSEILESNGSSSMATVCAGTLALMDAGISIKRPASGLAMGLIMDKGKEIILSDILGDEDYIGDMDLKVAGTKKGITACQMDIKIDGISYKILKKVFKQAYQGRIFILQEMLKTLSMPRVPMKPNIPKIFNLKITKGSIGFVIGPGGKTIQEIQKKTNTIITIKEKGEFGIVEIFGKEENKINKATDCIKNITFLPELGGVYDAKVKYLKEFGAIVEILPGKEYLLHISEINWEHEKNVEDVLKIGDIIRVKFMGIDSISRKIIISRKVLLPSLE
ncbi:polyribonucleotide nucleotidyltransferase [Candidatus Uzinura diaspidicola str. ASNER]|uniref:Polyribonucleotide nucleotidyltransferase n=1 Tax=Candidatus Uzinura diaspidicola str. ASNER TaxID=1133592 RepID=L7VJJ7_9FLAO|nr:polyribonucleotide nucleotidyltransferase [Candidatus Uzinura diaspidicola str. ASNER]